MVKKITMARRRTIAEDIINKERYFAKWLACEKKNHIKRQMKIEENELSLEQLNESRDFQYKTAFNKSDDTFDAVIAKEEDGWIHRFDNERLRTVMFTLTAKQREILRLIYQEGYKPVEVAAKLKMSGSAVSQQIKRIEENIKNFLLPA